MDPKQWARIESILEQAFELQDDERASFLALECGDDSDLRTEIEAMLEADSKAPQFLESDAASFAGVAFEVDQEDRINPPAEPGQRLGPYRLLKEIGHGGMSVVYLAERADGEFDRQVAVKLLRHLGGGREMRVQRFRAERQILASLEHPLIARVYGGGVTEGGWPYLVMELVDGSPITDFCTTKSLSLDKRLDLFDDVCEAVQHAHQHLVVHRDLKPGNILVTKAGDVKLLDFGIAKLLDEDAASSLDAPVTATGMQVLTPQYAAPEQVRGEAISTATDVYALGLILFELLTGTKPYEVGGQTPTEIENLICESVPPRPSSVRAEVKGDLDTIILKALRKEPENRYGSTQELRDDLARFRDGRPVRARPLTRSYRARKYLRRNRIAVAFASVIGLMLVTFAVSSAVQQRETARQRDEARLQARKASEVTEFMLGLFEANDPSEALGDTVTALELLERGVERAGRLESQALVRAEMLDVMGRAYHSLGQFDRADTLLTQALELRQSETASEMASIVRTLSYLGRVRKDRADYHSADSLLLEAIRLSESDGVADSLSASILNELAQLREVQGSFAEAESLHSEVLRIRLAQYGEEHPAVGQSLHNLAVALKSQGRFKDADSLFVRALAVRQRLLPPNHPAIGNTLTEFAANREQLGDVATADSLYRIALVVQRHVLGSDHPTVSSVAMQLANLLTQQGKFTEADSLQMEVLESRRRRLGENHPQVGESLFSLAFLSSQMGDYTRAEQRYQAAIELWMPTLGEEHPYVTLAYNNLAAVLGQQGRYSEAEALNREVLRRNQEKYGQESPQVAVSLGNLGDGLTELGEYEQAEENILEALRIHLKLFGEAHRRTADSHAHLGKLNYRRGDYAEAEAQYQTSLTIRRAVHGPDHPRVAYSLHGLATTLWELGRIEESESAFEEALAIRRSRLGDENPETQKLLVDFIGFCSETGRSERAEELRSIGTRL